MHTYERWIELLEEKTLTFLTNQQLFRGLNGDEHDRAIDHLVRKKRAAGEALPARPKQKRQFVEEEDDDDFVIEHLPSGPKGQTTRTKVPRSVHSG